MTCDTLRAAADDIGSARRSLEVGGASALPDARVSLERAVARLAPAAVDERLPRDVRAASLRCRVMLSSHLLAAEDFEAAGARADAVVSLLHRAADSSELEAAILDALAGADGRR